jgi:D-glycero-D-manno-heptose 1,7-bisphosphate phosphatase
MTTARGNASNGTLPARPGIFILRDGVLCEREAPGQAPNHAPSLIPGALEGLRVLARLPARIIVLAPQVAGTHELGPRRALIEAHHQLRSSLRAHGARIDAIRSFLAGPAAGRGGEARELARLLQRAARLYTVELPTSVVVCDSWAGVEAALAVGCQPVLVMTGRGREQLGLPCAAGMRARTWYTTDLAGAALGVEAQLQAAGSALTVA